MAEDLGHSAGDPRRSAMRNARLCRLLAEQGIDVVCASRENIPEYREIYVRVPLEELGHRDSKRHLFDRARRSGCRRDGGNP
jgi:adenylylsulfate kinase-like enzyme